MNPFVFPDTRLLTVAGEIVQLSLRLNPSLDRRSLPSQREIQSLIAAIVKYGNDRDYRILGDGYVLLSTRKDWGISDKYIFSCENGREPLASRPYKYIFEIHLLPAPRDKEYKTGDNSLTAAHHPELSAAASLEDTANGIKMVAARDKDMTSARTYVEERHVDNANRHTLNGSATSPSSIVQVKEALNDDNGLTVGLLEYIELHEERHVSNRDDDGLNLDALGAPASMDPPSFGSPQFHSTNLTQHHTSATPSSLPFTPSHRLTKRRSEPGSPGSQRGTIDEEAAEVISNQAYSGGEGSEATKLAAGNGDHNETGVEDTLNRVKRPRVEATEAERSQVDDEDNLNIENVEEVELDSRNETREQNEINGENNTSGSIFGRYLSAALRRMRNR